MGHAIVKPRMTASDFLQWEANEPSRHEYVRGEVFAMAGGEDRNATVAGNLYLALRTHLRGTPCRTFMVDVKLRVEAADCFFYPDVMVTCSEADAADRLVKREPVMVAEVLSAGTAAYDRGEKFAVYRQLPSLREYLLIDPQTRRSDLYRLGGEGFWVLHPVAPDQPLTLTSVQLNVSADLLWDEVPPAEEAQRDGTASPRSNGD